MGTFLNAVKNLINSLTAKTSSTASTADIVQLYGNDGTPNGKISLADLASVLGGLRIKGSLSSVDNLNDKQKGLYTCNITLGGLPENIPEGLDSSFIYIGVGEGTTWGFQLIVTTNVNGSTSIYLRVFVSSSFRNWVKIQTQE
jgi:hypothetical protein